MYDNNNPNQCRLRLKILYSHSRYVGCHIQLCGLITDANGVSQSLFNTICVCPWYWGSPSNINEPQSIPINISIFDIIK